MKNNPFNKNSSIGIGTGRLNVQELKNKSEDEKIEYLVQSLTGQINQSAEELDLDITGRYKVIKKIMDNTNKEVKDYTEKIKQDLNTLKSISDDIDSEDSLVKDTSRDEDGIRVFETLLEILRESKLYPYLVEGFRDFRYHIGSMYAVKDNGEEVGIDEFGKHDFKFLLKNFSYLTSSNIDNDELNIDVKDFYFYSRGNGDLINSLMKLELKNSFEFKPKPQNIIHSKNDFNLLKILLSSELNEPITQGYRVFEYSSGELYGVTSDGKREKIEEFKPSDFQDLISEICIESRTPLNKNRELMIKTDEYKLKSRGTRGDKLDLFYLNIRELSGLPVENLK